MDAGDATVCVGKACDPWSCKYGCHKSNTKLISPLQFVTVLVFRHVCGFPRISNCFCALGDILRAKRMKMCYSGTTYGQEKIIQSKLHVKPSQWKGKIVLAVFPLAAHFKSPSDESDTVETRAGSLQK